VMTGILTSLRVPGSAAANGSLVTMTSRACARNRAATEDPDGARTEVACYRLRDLGSAGRSRAGRSTMTGRLHHLWAALLPLVLVGCGADEGPRDGRPAAPTNVSVSAEHGIVTVDWEHDGVDTTGHRVSRQPVNGSTAYFSLAEVYCA